MRYWTSQTETPVVFGFTFSDGIVIWLVEPDSSCSDSNRKDFSLYRFIPRSFPLRLVFAQRSVFRYHPGKRRHNLAPWAFLSPLSILFLVKPSPWAEN